jgi:hypothetical protein
MCVPLSSFDAPRTGSLQNCNNVSPYPVAGLDNGTHVAFYLVPIPHMYFLVEGAYGNQGRQWGLRLRLVQCTAAMWHCAIQGRGPLEPD